MNLTHKAIARMTGYRVASEWRQSFGSTSWQYGDLKQRFKWYDVDEGSDSLVSSWYDTEAEAWGACCVVNGLIDWQTTTYHFADGSSISL